MNAVWERKSVCAGVAAPPAMIPALLMAYEKL